MKYFVRVVLLLFIGNIFVENIVETASKNGYFEAGALGIENSSVKVVKNCTPADFEESGSCTLQCSAYNCTGRVSEVNPQWNYKAQENSIEYYSILDGKSLTYSNNSYNLSLTLEDFRSGFYIANFSCSDQQLNCSFQILAVKGVPLGGLCNNSRNCTALNAECINQKCTCPSDYPVQFSHSNDTPSCLPESTIGSECMVNDQCTDDDQDLICQMGSSDIGICSCKDHTYRVRYVEEMGKMMCIQLEYYGEECTYDEECEDKYYDYNMECDSGVCDCEYGYYYDYYYNRCVYNPWTAYLSVTAVIGIVFGVIFLVILIVVAFALCLRPKRLNRRPPPVPPTTVDNQFASFNEPSVMWSAGQQPGYPMDTPPNYAEAGGLDIPPPPFESEIVIKTRLEDPPIEANSYSSPYGEQPQQQQWLTQPNQPSQVQQQHLDLYTPQPVPSEMQPELNVSTTAQGQQNSKDMFFFQNPNYQTNLGFDADC